MSTEYASSYGFPMDSRWFPHGHQVVPNEVPMDSVWFRREFLMCCFLVLYDLHMFPKGFPWLPYGLVWPRYVVPMATRWFLMVGLWVRISSSRCSYCAPLISLELVMFQKVSNDFPKGVSMAWLWIAYGHQMVLNSLPMASLWFPYMVTILDETDTDLPMIP